MQLGFRDFVLEKIGWKDIKNLGPYWKGQMPFEQRDKRLCFRAKSSH